MKRTQLAVAVLVIAVSVSSQAAFGAFQERQNEQTAVGHCQGALPSFEGALRKRPLGIANEGTTIAFVNCGMSTQMFGSRGISQVAVALTNKTASAVNVSCALISGLGNQFESTLVFPKTIVAAVGPNEIFWSSATDGQGTRFKTSSIQCALPPGTEINGTLIFFDTDVGL